MKPIDRDTYARAERFLFWNADSYCRHLEVDHRWIGDSDCFTYTRQTDSGREDVIVDAATGTRRMALPDEIVTPSEEVAGELRSPDTHSAVFIRGNDLWLRAVGDGAERRLTDDGEYHYAYAKVPGSSAGFRSFIREASEAVPVVLWSPDSRRLLTYRLDERQVKELHRYRYAFPGDTHKPVVELMIFEVLTGRRIRMKHEPLPVTMLDPVQDDRVWWDDASNNVYVIPREEGQQRAQLLVVNGATGDTRVLIEERSRTYVDIAGSAWNRAVRTLRDGRIVWYSERDDWGHLYLYGSEGSLIRQVTAGAWKVCDIVRVDEADGLIYFTAVGREPGEDPYQRHLYAVGIEGGPIRLLTPENADHDIRIASPDVVRRLIPGNLAPEQQSFSPTGRYFIDTYSRPDLPPHTVVRSKDGRLISTVERADISRLEEGGLRLPEPFEVLAADGKTRLYGTLYRPSTFDPSMKYPLIDVIYPGPQMIATPKTFKGGLYGLYAAMCTQGLAELGFIVVTLDGRGTPMRSKSFHDVSYGKMEQAGHLEDHIAAMRDLASRYPYMDLERVGITGHSGGGFASTRALLTHPDFYKVAVSLSGNHDQRGYLLVWGPTYQGSHGEVDFDRAANAGRAANLRGKLLLMHGELDDNVHPALTMQLVDALIRANKDFDCLLLPGEDHMLSRGALPYVHRKTWDYFVRHLMGCEPPGVSTLSG